MNVVEAGDEMDVSEVVAKGRFLGVRGLPDADRMTTGRVWPGGAQGWVGEIGEGQNIRAIDHPFASMPDAIKAVHDEIRRLRDEAVDMLAKAGGKAADLTLTRRMWPVPVIKVYADEQQQQPWLLQLME